MIYTKEQLIEYLNQDAKASKHNGITPKLFGDEIWKFQYCLRYCNYYYNKRKKHKTVFFPFLLWRIRYHHLSTKLGFTIPFSTKIGKGFSIAHYGSLVINGTTVIGENCRIHEGVCIGSTNGKKGAAVIGNNVFIATGAKIIGHITIADNVAIGANAVVVKDIDIPGTTWGGVPARMISQNDSHSNLSNMLDMN
ncbi:MAG: serine acetyltransferase [Clostridia bacterium]|nr:serine acetyltransferase [Clostridia bacterium]